MVKRWKWLLGLACAGVLLSLQVQGVAEDCAVAQEEPSVAVAANLPAAGSEQYVIGKDDQLGINVWKEPDLTQSIPVRSDGRITLPLIGEVIAAGKTPAQLEQELADRLAAYLNHPRVTVLVLQVNSRKFNILGRVSKPGAYALTSSMTVLDAIAEAGGFQDFAKQKEIYILREEAHNGKKRISFNYRDVIRGIHPEQNIRIEPHDTIVVP
jgi:polysaccharide export outer membrane protein